MHHGISYNIIVIANHFFFTYHNITLELGIFLLSPTEVTKTSDFIYAFEEK